MNTVVFAGPTLSTGLVHEQFPELTYLGPAAKGDLYLACRRGAQAIALIDGFFDQSLAVWHKEILFALSHGCLVCGAASMGALRAVELEPFGMVGLGQIFEWYRTGFIEDDDEVTVAHATAEHQYRSLSVALVNVRATLERAVLLGIIEAEIAKDLIHVTKSIFYPHRDFPAILSRAADRGMALQGLSRLKEWLEEPGSRCDQKREDAVALLQVLSKSPETLIARKTALQPHFRLEYTEAWHEFKKPFDAQLHPANVLESPENQRRPR